MRWYAFTRFPSPRFDNALATGFSELDQYLQDLDQCLVGAKSVRRLTLEEARDHLLEHTEMLIAQGKNEEEAASEAIQSFGSAEAHCKTQRKERVTLFFRMLVSFGAMFAFLMTIFAVIGTPMSEIDWVLIGQQFIFYALFYGTFMSYWFTFGFAQAKPTQSRADVEEGDVLRVYSGKASKIAAVFLIIMMSFIGVMALLGTVGIAFMVHNHPIVNLLIAAIGLQLAFSAPIAFGEYLLTQNELQIRVIGEKQTIPLAQIQRIETLSRTQRLLRVRMGEPHILHWGTNGELNQTMVLLNGEMHNSDQLLAALREHAERNQAATT
ncbi:MAG: hypothetical protein HLUCCO02_05900 [Idiomarinaceae bacterium HL-53]|nr:MAG: hypothetical protein HLUCCO02_05900 [Idiomarinaceae bacterium HL-53]CUS48087.1 hypothetical protein Ga0003345_1026 [Idiomarinaceae bacterium HL-53]